MTFEDERVLKLVNELSDLSTAEYAQAVVQARKIIVLEDISESLKVR
jgi:hypothetical protein